MSDYNFSNLYDNEFENLARDLLAKKLNLDIEVFTKGRDGGVDAYYYINGKTDIIIQCKIRKKYAQLKHDLILEKEKVDKLKPARYIVITNLGLTFFNKLEIKNIFSKCINSTRDILGLDDLNVMLRESPDIVEQHPKLWISSAAIIRKIVNEDIKNKSDFCNKNIRRNMKIYVQNESYNEALKILNANNFAIISGIPGIGKTTLAKMLLYRYLISDYELIKIEKDINEAFHTLKEGKQIFYYDDFLGKNFLEQGLSKNEDSRLIDFIELIRNSKNKKLIMTTREHILSQAQNKYHDTLRPSIFVDNKCIIKLESYSRYKKAEILRNHLLYYDVPKEATDSILANKNYNNIINHKNYSPRVIEFMVDNYSLGKDTQRNFYEHFIENLNNPKLIWKYAFEEQINKLSRYILYIIFVSGTPMRENELHKSLNLFLPEYEGKDFNRSLKELENSFISISKDKKSNVIIEFLNPSMSDFVECHLKDDRNLIQEIIQKCIYYNQLFHAFTTDSDSDKILLNSMEIDMLEQKFIQKFEKLSSSLIIRSFWSKNDFSYVLWKNQTVDKLSMAISFFKLEKRQDLLRFIEQKLDICFAEESPYHNTSDLMFLVKGLSTKIEIDATKVLSYFYERSDTLNNLDNFLELIETFPEAFQDFINDKEREKEASLSLRRLITRVLIEEIQTARDNDYSLDEIEDLNGNLNRIEKITKLDFSELRYDLARLKEEASEHDLEENETINSVNDDNDIDDDPEEIDTLIDGMFEYLREKYLK